MSDILEFQGEYRWLSNFWPADVVLDGMYFPSVENAYQAAKASVTQACRSKTVRLRKPSVSVAASRCPPIGTLKGLQS